MITLRISLFGSCFSLSAITNSLLPFAAMEKSFICCTTASFCYHFISDTFVMIRSETSRPEPRMTVNNSLSLLLSLIYFMFGGKSLCFCLSTYFVVVHFCFLRLFHKVPNIAVTTSSSGLTHFSSLNNSLLSNCLPYEIKNPSFYSLVFNG